MSNLNIRPMEIKDIPAVLEVDRATFSIPWTTDIFNHELVDNQHAYYYVVENEEKIIGYSGMWIVIDEAQITNIAISPEFRGKKIGEKLFSHMMLTAMKLGTVQLSLEVRVSNVVAQKLYRKFGLTPGGIRKKYYTDNQEDALVMWVKLR